MFDNLSGKLQDAFAKLKKKGKLTEADIKMASREIKMALLEADVNYKAVKEFTEKVSARALGDEVMKSLTPAQQFIKIVRDEMTDILTGEDNRLKFSKNGPTVILLAGTQGSGKTTTAAKLAQLLKKQNKRVMMAACDTYRPAAVKQLQTLGDAIDIPVHYIEDKPENIAMSALTEAKDNHYDVLIVDTAGRLTIDEEMMKEIVRIAGIIEPTEVLLCIDAMSGQEAVNTARAFDERLDLTGVIMTKLDSDARGGAALSVVYATNKPIKFCGVGEKISDFEVFNAERIVGRILGMGDILSFIEKAEEAYDKETAEEMSRRMLKNELTLEDFLDQIEQMQNMGGLEEVLKMMPGGNKQLKGLKTGETDMQRFKAIIQSMTKKERLSPGILNASRRRRIASGSGTTVSDVNKLITGYEQSKKMMKQMSGKHKGGKMKFPFM